MEKSALTTGKINIQLNDVRKKSISTFYESKKKKWKKKFPLKRNSSHWNGIVPTETEYLIIENVEKVSSVEQWKKGATFIVGESMLARIEEKRIPGNRRAKFRIFPGAKTHGMYDFLKTLLKKNSDNIILYIGNNNSVNGWTRNILNGIMNSLTCE